ncbi:S1C family serine protease [Radiobacillus sp. PE A8.2]|uniref:S1C family serine protease n=1 Tax=Radiobacillus sp. PE A8.2 TaxID=3380349 RepID=UPI00388EE0A4
MNKRHTYLPIFLSVIILIIGASCIFFIYKDWTNSPIEVKNTLALQVAEQEASVDLTSIIHESQKSVVQIEALSDASEKIGSGFLYNEKGDIITNAHVVKDATSIYVKTANARTYNGALVGIGKDTDIAVIRVPQLANQAKATLDLDYNPTVGDEILAVGSPLGFQNTVSLGIVAGENRTFSIDEYNYENVLQISANITHGNSGGPLIDRETGDVIAINSAGTEEGGIGFSIPLKKVIEQIETWSEKADHRELEYQSATELAQSINPVQLKDDATYLITYFFDSLAIRDYINAYALLGSEWQSRTTYQAFRENYIHLVETNISNLTSTFDDETNQVMLTLTADNVLRTSNQETKTETYQYKLYVGYENDQLKIIDSNRELVSE